jgi:amino acid adenylation domain-containing protein
LQSLAIEYLYRSSQRHSEKTAICHDGKKISFGELWSQSLLLADALKTLFGSDSAPVVISIPKSIHAVKAISAVQLAGHIFVPVDTNIPPARRETMLKELGEHHIIEYAEGRFTVDGREIALKENGDPEETAGLEKSLMDRLAGRGSEEPLYVMFTSGTTGVPKGVAISNLSIINYIEWAADTYGVNHEEVIGNQSPLFFDHFIFDMYMTFARGCSLHIIPEKFYLFPGTLVDYLIENRITLTFFVPSVYTHLVLLNLLDCSEELSLKKLLFAGEPMPLKTLKKLRELFPDALLTNLYGPTETAVDATYWIFGDELDGLEKVTIGKPCRNVKIMLLDDNGQPVHEKDKTGEICIGGLGVSPGYWNNPELTKEKFIQNPEHSSYREIFYRSGDLGYLSSSDGLLYLVGRKDSQFKHLGRRIEPGDIENGLLRAEFVETCSVQYDAENSEIVAFFSASAPVAFGELRRHLANELPNYMIPRRYVQLETFPLAANRKIDRKALWESYVSGLKKSGEAEKK